MKLIRFDLPSGQEVDVAAPSVQAGLSLLCELDYLNDADAEDTVGWRVREDGELVTVHLDGEKPDEDERAMPDAEWDEERGTLTASAASWASTVKDDPVVIGDSEA